MATPEFNQANDLVRRVVVLTLPAGLVGLRRGAAVGERLAPTAAEGEV